MYRASIRKWTGILLLLLAALPGNMMAQDGDFSIKQMPDSELCLISCLHCDKDGVTHSGRMIVNKRIAEKVLDIMKQLYKAKYPIEKMRPAEEYDNDDERSMRDNNSSAYNYRNIGGTKVLSKHALGLAIDINPLYNPYVRKRKDGSLDVRPEAGRRYMKRHSMAERLPYEIVKGDLCYRLFTEAGFTWGGNWKSLKDYQHFEYNR